MTREGAESARAASAAVLALAFMVFGGVFLFVGVAGLFGLIEG